MFGQTKNISVEIWSLLLSTKVFRACYRLDLHRLNLELVSDDAFNAHVQTEFTDLPQALPQLLPKDSARIFDGVLRKASHVLWPGIINLLRSCP
jgi:hypothetical protein